MLKDLDIRNYTIIDHLHVQFHQGFSVITGETGAGKSIILGALSLLMGNRVESNVVRAAEKKCVIEANFSIKGNDFTDFFSDNDIEYDAEECIIRREISANGKSRGFINDTPVLLQQMKQLGDMLLDIHSQHQNLLLRKENFQLNTLDVFAQNQSLLTDFHSAYGAFVQARKQMAEEEQRIAKAKENEDYLRFMLKGIEEANLSEGEEENLESEIILLSHAEEIKERLFRIDELMAGNESIIEKLKQVEAELSHISNLPTFSPDLEARIDTLTIEAKDIEREINTQLNKVDFDPALLDLKQERMEMIVSLKKKHHVESISDLLKLQHNIASQLQQIDNSEELLEQSKKEVVKSQMVCEDLAKQISTRRKKAGKEMEKIMATELAQLGIPKVQFKIDITSKELSSDGNDNVSFLFSANRNMPVQPISQVASGGEISRVMLCLKSLISNAQNLPTIIFDEIDTGVSGAIAEKMAQIMRDMGQGKCQVISITHLPQIAAMGQYHYRVSKTDTDNGTISNMTQLSQDQRIEEIAQMLSGANVSASARENAKHLLKL